MMAIGASITLAVIIFYASKHATLAASVNSDGIVNTYLFEHFKFNDMIVPGNHTLLLKWPLFALQSLFHYNFTSYSILNFFFLFSTLWGWCVGLTILFGKKHYVLICMSLIVLLVGSIIFPFFLIFGSLRNIEYPIGLFFLLSLRALLVSDHMRKLKVIGIILSSLLFSLAIASDSLMTVTFVLPAAIIIATYWLKGGKLTKKLILISSLLIGTVLFSFIIKNQTAMAGIAILHYDVTLNPIIVKYDILWPSLVYAFQQLFDIVGADIASRPVDLENSLYFFKFLILIISLGGLISVTLRFFKSKAKDIINGDFFALTALALGFFATLTAYIMLGMVYTQLPNGQLVDAGASRYIEVLPLIMVAGIVVSFQLIPRSRRIAVLTIFIATASLCAVASLNTIREDTSNRDTSSNTSISQQKKIANILTNNGVQFIASGYWDGATTRFWSDNRVKYISINNCDNTAPDYNTRISWLKEDHYSKTALVINRRGPNADYWKCSDQQLSKIYGTPVQKIAVSADSTTGPVVWIYNYDIRSKLISNY